MKRDVTPVEINESPPAHRRIAWWFENTILRAVKKLLNDVSQTLRDILNLGVADFVEETEADLGGIIRSSVQTMLDDPGVSDEVKDLLRETMTGKHQAGFITMVGVALSVLTGTTSGSLAPLNRHLEQQAEVKSRSYLFDPPTLAVLRTRNIITSNQYDTLMAMNGVSEDGIRAMRDLARPLLTQEELARLMWRDRLTSGAVEAELGHYGYNEVQQDMLRELMEVLPGVGDLVSMAVREAFNDEVAARFGYDENYPSEAARWAKKQGLDPEWFQRYWRAHWTLPGLTQVREMFNRGFIDADDVDTYLRAADLPVFWRGKLQEWMKSEVTRVDLRRIFSLGVIGPGEVYERYLKLGYTEDDAALLTEWTVAAYGEETRDATKGDILSMYEDGILNEEEATAYLRALGYLEDYILLLLAQRDLKRQEKFENKVFGYVEDLYVAGVYDRSDVFAELGKLDAPGSFIEQSLQVWDLEKRAKVSIPTTAQLRDMTLEGVISEQQFREQLALRGYSEQYADWYVQLWLEE